MDSVFLTGATGFLGAHVAERLRGRYRVVTLGKRPFDEGDGVEHREADLSNPDSAASQVATERPDLVLHLAAVTSPDVCEKDPALARTVNEDATRALARAARDNCRRFVYVSTDLVFSGERPPYEEADLPEPLSVYGETKLGGEVAAAEALGGRAVVARVALLYGPRRRPTGRKSFAETMVERARGGEEVTLFEDQFRTPLYVEDAAESLVRLLELDEAPPLVHLGGPERVSRYQMGLLALEVNGLSPTLARASTMDAHPSTAPRPRDVSLDTPLARKLGLPSRGVRAGLESMARTSW